MLRVNATPAALTAGRETAQAPSPDALEPRRRASRGAAIVSAIAILGLATAADLVAHRGVNKLRSLAPRSSFSRGPRLAHPRPDAGRRVSATGRAARLRVDPLAVRLHGGRTADNLGVLFVDLRSTQRPRL